MTVNELQEGGGLHKEAYKEEVFFFVGINNKNFFVRIK